MCTDSLSVVTLFPSLLLGGCLQATDPGVCIFCNVVLLLFFDRLFLRGKGNKSPKTHVNVKKSSVLLVVVFYVVQNKNNLKVLVPVSGDLG